MKPDPRIKLPAEHFEQPEQNNLEGGDQKKMQYLGSKQRHNRKTLLGGMPRLCRNVQDMLPAYSDESLNAGQRQTVARHLDVCAACRYELRLLARSEQALIGAASAVSMPGDLRAGFYARLAMTPRCADKRRAFVPALAVCGLLLIASATAYRLRVTSGGSVAQTTGVSIEARSVAKTHPAESPHLLPRQQVAPVARLPESLARNRSSRPASALAYQGSKQSSMPTARKTLPVGGGAHQALASAMTGHRAELPQEQSGRHKERAWQRIAVVPRAALSQRLLTVAASKRKTASGLSGHHTMQVALLTREERDAPAPRTRSDVRLTRGEAAPTTNSFGFQTDAMDANAVQLAKDRHSDPTFRYENNLQAGLTTTPAGDVEREQTANARDGGAMGSDAGEMDGVSFQVKDAQRGFVSGTRAESRMQMRGGRQVLSLHLEDEDRPEPDTADRPMPARPAAQPAQNTKTGSEKNGDK